MRQKFPKFSNIDDDSRRLVALSREDYPGPRNWIFVAKYKTIMPTPAQPSAAASITNRSIDDGIAAVDPVRKR
jgi:hypothetical protein